MSHTERNMKNVCVCIYMCVCVCIYIYKTNPIYHCNKKNKISSNKLKTKDLYSENVRY